MPSHARLVRAVQALDSRVSLLVPPIMPNKRKSSNVDPAPTNKRARGVRGKRGALERMPEMPLDVLFLVCHDPSPSRAYGIPFDRIRKQIFSHLMPMDLLNLARTAKVFRRFLMARSTASLWRAARSGADNLPDCPSHLSEPAYANLVFDTHCQVHLPLVYFHVYLNQSSRVVGSPARRECSGC